MPKIKNILIFVIIATVFILLYVFFFKKDSDEANLISDPLGSILLAESSEFSAENSLITQDFLTLLLSVKNIKLDDSIFSDTAFANLRDSSIVLTPDGNEGRPNPFAPFGADSVIPLVSETVSRETGPVPEVN